MNLGPFFFDTREIMLIVVAVILTVLAVMGIDIWLFDTKTLLTLVVIFLIVRGLFKSINNDIFFFHAVTTLFVSIFLPVFQVVIFYFVTFAFLKILKVI